MGEGITAGWLYVSLIESCVGGAMLMYGWKQKKPRPLVFGIAISTFPMLLRGTLAAAAVGAGLLVLYFLLCKWGIWS